MKVLSLFYSDYKQSFLKRLAADNPQFEFKPYQRRPRDVSEEALRSLYFNENVPNAPSNVSEIFDKLTQLNNSLGEIEGQVNTIQQVANVQVKNLKTQSGYEQKEQEIQNLVKQLAVVSGLAQQTGRVVYRLGQQLAEVRREKELVYQLSSEEKLSHGLAFLKQYPDILQKLNEHLAQVEAGRKANGVVLDKIRAITMRGPKLAQFNQVDPLDQFIRQLLEMLTYYNDVLVNVGEPLAAAAKKENKSCGK